MSNKKALASVVATSLLIVVAVVAVSGFQGWVNSYSSKTFAEMENHQDNFETKIKVDGIIGNSLYLKSDLEDSFKLLKVIDKNRILKCVIQDDYESSLKSYTRLLMTFDEETFNGTHVKDLSGYGNDGIVNGPTFTNENCLSGGCFEFNSTSKYIDINLTNKTKSFLNNKSNNYAFSIWFYKFSEIGSHDTFFSSQSFRMQTNNNMEISLSWTNGTNTIASIRYPEPIILKKYNHLLIDKYYNKIYIFLNGNKVHISTIGLNYRNLSNLRIGLDALSNIGGPDRFEGTLDEVAIYSKALTDSEVKALYKAQKAKLYEQIIPIGVKEIDLSDCNLISGEKYDIIIFTDNQKIEEEVIAR